MKSELFKALSHPIRVAVLNALVEKGEMTHAELLSTLDLGQVTIYPHLQKMSSLGLLDKIAVDQRTVYYKVNKEVLEEIKDEIGGILCHK